jgi:hypothetical protein
MKGTLHAQTMYGFLDRSIQLVLTDISNTGNRAPPVCVSPLLRTGYTCSRRSCIQNGLFQYEYAREL